MAGALHESHDHGRPLLEPAGVQGDLRGQHGRAVQVSDGPQVSRFAGRAGGHPLVEPGHALLDSTQGDVGRSRSAQRGQLQVRVPGLAGHGEGSLGVSLRHARVDGSHQQTQSGHRRRP